jgi:hypothetical protein
MVDFPPERFGGTILSSARSNASLLSSTPIIAGPLLSSDAEELTAGRPSAFLAKDVRIDNIAII